MSNTHHRPDSLVFPVTTLADTEHVDTCTNLRPDTHGGLAAVGIPATLVSLPGATPVDGGCYTLSDGSKLTIVMHNGALKSLAPDGSVSIIANAVALTDTPTCILPVDRGIIVMFASTKPCRYNCTEGKSVNQPVSWTRTDLFPDLAPLMFSRSDMARISVEIPEFSLGSSYETDTRTLTDEDSAKVDNVMRDAYIRLSDNALSRGLFIQPVMARYRLIGTNGAVIYTSAPVLIAPDEGVQSISAEFTFSGTGFRRMEYARLRAQAFFPYTVRTRPDDLLWNKLVREVELELTPQLHPYSETLPGTHTRVSSTSKELVMRATLPGVRSEGEVGAPGTRMATLITAILDNQDMAFYPDMNLHNSTEGELAMLERILKVAGKRSEPAPELEVKISAPNSFTAKTVSDSGNVIVWGGIKAIPFKGYSLLEMTVKASDTDNSLPTAVKVDMSDGTSVVRSVTSGTRRPLAFSPLIVYPSPDAVSVTLLSDERALTLPLTPSPCRRFAYYLNPALKPVEFNEFRDTFVEPSAVTPMCEYPGAVVVTKSDAPLVPVAVTEGVGTAIHTLHPATQRANSVTAATISFYMFAPDGIHTLALSDGCRTIKLAQLNPEGVASPRCVTPIPGGVAVLAGDRVIAYTGTGAHSVTLLTRCDVAMLGYCSSFGELWCIPSASAPVTVVSTDGKVRYTREGIDVSGVYSDGAIMRVFTADGDILDPCRENDGPVTVCHKSSVRHNLKQNTEATLRIGLFGEDVNGSVTVRVSDGAPERESAVIASERIISGNLDHTTVLKMRVGESSRAHLGLNVTTSRPSTLRLEHS